MSSKRTLHPGEFLFKEGEWGGSLYKIIKGEVEILKKDEFQNLHILNVMQPGEIIGLTSFLISSTRLASSRAKTEVVIEEFDETRVKKMKMAVPNWMKGVLKDNLLRLQQMNHRYVELLANSKANGVQSKIETLKYIQITSIGNFIDKSQVVKVNGQKYVNYIEVVDLIKNRFYLRKNDILIALEVLVKDNLLTFAESPHRVLSYDDLLNLRKLSKLLNLVYREEAETKQYARLGVIAQDFIKDVIAYQKQQPGKDSKKTIEIEALFCLNMEKYKRLVVEEIVDLLESLKFITIEENDGKEYFMFKEKSLEYFIKYNRFVTSLIGDEFSVHSKVA